MIESSLKIVDLCSGLVLSVVLHIAENSFRFVASKLYSALHIELPQIIFDCF